MYNLFFDNSIKFQWRMLDRSKFSLFPKSLIRIKNGELISPTNSFDDINILVLSNAMNINLRNSCKYVIDFTVVQDLSINHMIDKVGLGSFNIPTYYAHRQHEYYSLLNDIDDDELVVFKSFYSSQTVGKLIIEKKYVPEVISDAQTYTPIEFNNKYGFSGKYDTAIAKNFLYNKIRRAEFFIQKAVKIKKEFRMLYFSDNTVLTKERENVNITSDNKRKERKNTFISHKDFLTKSNISPDTLNNLYEGLSKLLKLLKLPVISIDLGLIECNGKEKFVIFEYDINFGSVYPEYQSELANLLSINMEAYIKRYILNVL